MLKTTKSPRRNNKQTKVYRYTSTEVAEIAQCSVSYVRKVRAGLVNTETAVAQRVLHIDKFLEDLCDHLLEKINLSLLDIKNLNKMDFQSGKLDSLIGLSKQFKEDISGISVQADKV